MLLKIKNTKKYFLAFFLISAACFCAYANSLGNPFIWDDQALVVKNPLIRSCQNIGLSFTSDLYFKTAAGSNFYRPLQTVSYIFDYHFWQLNPFGFHLTNIFLQILASFFLFLFLASLSIEFPVALIAALFFAANPLHTESVTYISGRAEMLMAIFIFLSALFFIRCQNNKHKALFYWFSIFSFAAALLSKEAAVVFPLIPCAYIFYFSKENLREKHAIFRKTAPFFLIALVYVFIRLTFLNFSTIRPPALTEVSWYIRLSVLPSIIFTYFKLLILPVGLHMSRELARPVGLTAIFAAYFLLALIIFTCFIYLKFPAKNKTAAFMLFWSLVFFLPQSGIFPINAFVAEHFIYLSSISFYLLLTYILKKALRKNLFFLTAALICLFYILLTSGRNFEWRNPLVFYRNIIMHSADSFQAHNNLGLQYESLGKFDQARFHYQRALEIKPDLIEARSNLANLFFKLKLYEEAEREYKIIEKSPLGQKAGEIENNLGNIYEVTGKTEIAILKYKRALELDPGLKFAHFNLARIYFYKKDFDSAVFQIMASLGLKNTGPASVIVAGFLKNSSLDNAGQFYNNLGIEFAKNNLWPVSIVSFDCAIELEPESADYCYNLGFAYFNMRQNQKAAGALKQALFIQPNHLRSKNLIARIKRGPGAASPANLRN